MQDSLMCRHCGTTQPLYTKIIFNPHAMACIKEAFASKHKKCGMDGNRARANFHWRNMMALLESRRIKVVSQLVQ